MMKWLRSLHSWCNRYEWIIFLLLLVLILRLPSLVMPHYYGDEEIYFVMGRAWRTGVPLYKSMFDHKPPLIYILAGLAPTMFLFRGVLLLVMLVHTWLFWKLSQLFWAKTRPFMVYVSTLLFVLLTTLPTFEGLTVNAELFMMVPVTFSILLLWKAKKSDWKRYLLAGLVSGIGWLFKIPVAFDVAAVGLYFLVFERKSFWESVKGLFSFSMLSFLLGFILPLASTFVYYYLKGSGPDYLATVITVNLGYVSSWSTSSYSFNPFKSGLLVRGILLLLFTIGLYFSRKKLDRSLVFASLWFAFSLFGALLSDRPYPHYLQEPALPFALLLPFLFVAENVMSWIVIAILTASIILTQWQIKFGAYPTTSVYQTYWEYVTKKISWSGYMARFDNAPQNYAVAQYLNERLSSADQIYIWGTDPTIYNLTDRLPSGGKYIVSFHVRDLNQYDYTMTHLQAHPPLYIVFFPDAGEFPALTAFISHAYVLAKHIGTAQIYIRL